MTHVLLNNKPMNDRRIIVRFLLVGHRLLAALALGGLGVIFHHFPVHRYFLRFVVRVRRNIDFMGLSEPLRGVSHGRCSCRHEENDAELGTVFFQVGN